MKKFDQYCANLSALSLAPQEDLKNEFVLSGIIHKFSLQFELAWKMLKELLQYEGRSEAASGSPREILKTAFSLYDCLDEEVWLSMLRDRNSISRTYDVHAAQRLVQVILDCYLPAFSALQTQVTARYAAQLDEL